ncbi:glycosyltransferase family 4 protein [Flavobacterium algicola]|uniref:glycosyltransferase family 4 protein n=1 Tax=Flavobacterium algicola TaxID=556529 RepID=UPI001EFE6095|nr:glycosyltransferase family 4 protein [Flavobacterium algicola]MCG9793877.1 glycosyltransferase family 4 protein [Flavobacterium algicola]
MRIIQLIDSLETGGAERMAVNYANALAHKISFSGLVATRKEGPLLQHLDAKTSYVFLNKQSATDPKAIWNLRRFVIDNKVDLIQVHSTSIVTGFLLKLVCPSIKLIWHDHYGDSDFLAGRKKQLFRMMLPFFDGVVAVNQQLKKWAKDELHFANSIYIPNFPAAEEKVTNPLPLKGVLGKRIVCLANLRVQKNHFLLLDIALKLKISHRDWTFHLIGKDFDDAYSKKMKDKIKEVGLEQHVFVYGSQNAIPQLLKQATIGILTSASEGLPVALLEYGWSALPVVATAVGQIPSIITQGENGFVVPHQEATSFHCYLVALITDESLQKELGQKLYETVQQHYSEESALQVYLPWIQKILK